jgi:RHS repeat-associated protein
METTEIAAMIFVRRALPHAQMNIIWKPHSTGKERDAESGNDYFGARYYASSMGRWLSPDYDGDDDGPPEPVPYADLSDPQSLNLYAYVQNNPLSRFDSEGHDCIYADGNGGGYVQRGDCTNAGGKDDNGIYVNGTIDVNSFQYNASNNSSSFSYTPYDAPAGTIGVGTLQGPDLNGGFDSGSLAAGVFGSGSASTWNNSYGGGWL